MLISVKLFTMLLNLTLCFHLQESITIQVVHTCCFEVILVPRHRHLYYFVGIYVCAMH